MENETGPFGGPIVETATGWLHRPIGVRKSDFIDAEVHLIDVNYTELMQHLVEQAEVDFHSGPVVVQRVRAAFVPDSPPSVHRPFEFVFEFESSF